MSTHRKVAGKESGFSNDELPEIRGYIWKKYGVELEEDLITMIEDLIERQREKVRDGK
jgi:hypothetical protein